MKTAPKFVLQGFWGARPEPLERTAERVAQSFALLSTVREPLGGAWHTIDGTAVPNDPGALRDLVAAHPVTDERGAASPAEGYTPRFRLGRWDLPQSEPKDLATFDIRSGPLPSASGHPVGSVVLTFDGEAIARAAQEEAGRLVEGFARAWQPDTLAFTDLPLLEARARRASGAGYPAWGYVAWLSDAISRSLEEVAAAETRRCGQGTLLATATWDPTDAAAVWEDLLDSRRLRAAPAVQATQPAF